MKEIKELYNKLSKIEYGWYDKNKNLVLSINKKYNFKKNYRMQDINKIIEHNHAICWEMCELERKYFKKMNVKFYTVFAVLKSDKKLPCHTFLMFIKDNKYYWFEASWKEKMGVREYNTKEELFDDIKDNFYEFTKTNDYDKSKIEFISYKKPLIKHINCSLFYYNALIFGKKLN